MHNFPLHLSRVATLSNNSKIIEEAPHLPSGSKKVIDDATNDDQLIPVFFKISMSVVHFLTEDEVTLTITF